MFLIYRDYMLLFTREMNYAAGDQTGRDTALVNGRMQFYEATNVLHPRETALTPYEVFTVQQGKSYRVRLYGFSVDCGYEVRTTESGCMGSLWTVGTRYGTILLFKDQICFTNIQVKRYNQTLHIVTCCCRSL